MGLDLAAQLSGLALPDGTTTSVTAPPPRGKTRSLVDDLARLDHVTSAVEGFLDDFRPHLVVMEGYAPGIRSSAAHRLAEIAGAVRLACHRAHAPLAIVAPNQVKAYATGRASARKSDMVLALYKRAALELGTEDEVDAWWLRAMGADHLGHPVATLPAAHRAVLDRISWPLTGQDVIA